MAYARILVLGSLTLLAVPTAAFADDSQTAGTASNASCNCDQVCADRAHAMAQRRAERRRLARRRAALHASNVPAHGPTTMYIDTTISRPVAGSCLYSATAQGHYQSNDPLGRNATAPVRNADVTANAALTCNGQLVRRQQQRFIFPTTSRQELVALLHERLGLEVPGSKCTFASTYSFEGGNLLARSVESSCPGSHGLAAVSGYRAPVRAVPVARGGGPVQVWSREPTAEDAHPGTH